MQQFCSCRSRFLLCITYWRGCFVVSVTSRSATCCRCPGARLPVAFHERHDQQQPGQVAAADLHAVHTERRSAPRRVHAAGGRLGQQQPDTDQLQPTQPERKPAPGAGGKQPRWERERSRRVYYLCIISSTCTVWIWQASWSSNCSIAPAEGQTDLQPAGQSLTPTSLYCELV